MVAAETMVVSRNGFGDHRRVRVLTGEATGLCIAVARGGDFALLPAPALAAYVPTPLVPAEMRSGMHGYEDGNRLLIVEPDETDPETFARLLAEGEKVRHTIEHVLRKRAEFERKLSENMRTKGF
jgi:hypothetical protein